MKDEEFTGDVSVGNQNKASKKDFAWDIGGF